MADASIVLRLTLADPVPGVRYSLQKDDAPFEPVTASDAPLSFDLPVRLSPDSRFLGPFVRREGPERRFVYLRIGQMAVAQVSEERAREQTRGGCGAPT